MSAVYDQFVGVADETTYGTGVAPTDFFEIQEESINASYERIESEGIRGIALRADRFAPNPKGAAGDFTFEVADKGLDFWLPHMLGAVSSTGDGTTTPIVATATPGSLDGKSFTLQVARWAAESASLVPFTYKGGKVASWEISAEVDGIVKCKVTCDFATEVVNGTGASETLATVTYPAGSQLMTFIGGTATIGGTSVAVNSISVTGDNGLKVDRYAMRGANSTAKREPKQTAFRQYGFTLGMEFENDAQSKRVADATAAGVLASVVLHFDSPQGGALDITMSNARFDEANANAGWDVIGQSVTGKALVGADGTDAISVKFTSVL